MLFEKIAADKYHNLVLSHDRYFPDYIYCEDLSNLQQKLILSWRLGVLNFKARYRNLYNNTTCIYRGCGAPDSLSHVVNECEYTNVDKPVDPTDWSQMLPFLTDLHEERVKVSGLPLTYV